MSGASLFHEGAQPKRLRDDFDNAPVQQRMGPERVPRRNPSTDQKKARTQMARQSSLDDSLTVESGIFDRLRGKQPEPVDQFARFRGHPAGWYLVLHEMGDVHGQDDLLDGPYPSKDAAIADKGNDDTIAGHLIIARYWDGTSMSTIATKESTTMANITEAEYLQRIASAPTMAEQTRLSAELAALRQQKSASLRSQASYGSLREASSRIAAAAPPAFARHSIASDWLGDVPTGAEDTRAVEASMRAEASIWYESRPEAVKANKAEVTAQAQGIAARVASQHGLAALAAREAFLAQVAHLNKVAEDTQSLSDTHVPSGSSLPEGVTNKDTFDDSLLTAPGGQDPQTEPGDSPSLKEGDAPEGDTSQGVENPAADTAHDTVKSTEYTDPLTSGGRTSARKVAEDQTSTEADKGDSPSLSEGDAPEGDHAEPGVLPAKGTGHDAGPGNSDATDSIDGTTYPKQASLRAIAASITPSEASAPFVTALGSLTSVESSVAGISGREIVAFVLRTAALDEGQRVALEAHLSAAVPPFRAEAAHAVKCGGCGTEFDGGRAKYDHGEGKELRCPSCNSSDISSAYSSRWSKKAAEGKVCSVCGDAIANTEGSWHHDNGEKHDHEAKPKDTSSDTSPSPDSDAGGGAGFRPLGGLTLDPTFAANIKTALPSYLDELDPAEQYADGYIDGRDAHEKSKPFEQGFKDGADGKPASHQYDYHS